jgi:hypothetical protein
MKAMNDAINQPIGWVKFWTPKDDWYYLEPAERNAYFDGYAEIIDRVQGRGARLIGTYKCRGQSTWARFEVWEFPDLQVLIDLTNDLEEIGHFQFFAEDHTVGRRYERSADPGSWVV